MARSVEERLFGARKRRGPCWLQDSLPGLGSAVAELRTELRLYRKAARCTVGNRQRHHAHPRERRRHPLDNLPAHRPLRCVAVGRRRCAVGNQLPCGAVAITNQLICEAGERPRPHKAHRLRVGARRVRKKRTPLARLPERGVARSTEEGSQVAIGSRQTGHACNRNPPEGESILHPDIEREV